MSEFQTSYYKFDSPPEDDDSKNEVEYLMHVPDRSKGMNCSYFLHKLFKGMKMFVLLYSISVDQPQLEHCFEVFLVTIICL